MLGQPREESILGETVEGVAKRLSTARREEPIKLDNVEVTDKRTGKNRNQVGMS